MTLPSSLLGFLISAARTISVLPPAVDDPGFSISPLPVKGSGDILDYAVELNSWFADDNDVIESFDLTITSPSEASPYDLRAAWVSIVGGNPSMLLTGGVPGRQYTLALQVTTTSGRRFSVVLSLQISLFTFPSAPVAAFPPPNALVLPSGSALLGSDGRQLLLV